MIPGKHYYICWRSKYNSIMGGMGGLPVNTDNRLWKNEGAPFVLSFYEEGITYHYAVRDDDAEDIIGRIGKWYEDNPDAPVPGNDQQDSASVELGTYRARVFPDVELCSGAAISSAFLSPFSSSLSSFCVASVSSFITGAAFFSQPVKAVNIIAALKATAVIFFMFSFMFIRPFLSAQT